MFPNPVRVAMPRFFWRVVSADANRHLFWGRNVFAAVFSDANGWSVRDYWRRVTFGLMDLSFDIPQIYWTPGDQDQNVLRNDRQAMLNSFRQEYLDGGGSLDGFHRVVLFVHPPPCNAGALGNGDLVLDQGGSVEMYQHEFGHLLGFQHSWGAGSVYDDPYCIMGATGPFDRPISQPAELNGFTFINPAFWRSGRRVAAASLYRRFNSADLDGSGQLTSGPGAAGRFDRRVVHAQLGQTAWIAALSEARADPVIVVAPLPSGGVLTVEYRTATGDDAGVKPGVVVHTIGSRPLGPGFGEIDPPWYEGAIPPHPGAGLTVAIGDRGYRVQILQTQGPETGTSKVNVTLMGAFSVPVYPHQQSGWRWCSKCQGLAFGFGEFVGPCPAGERHNLTDSGLYSLLHNVAPPAVSGWRWCSKCQGLTRPRDPSGPTTAYIPGPCPAGGPHALANSGEYHLLHGVEPMAGQPGWHWCHKCTGLAYGHGDSGPCPGGGHHEGSNRNYSVLHDVNLPTAQPDWRWCDKCQGLAYAGFGPGPCPAGGTHNQLGSFPYSVLHGVSQPLSQDNWRWCNKCQGLAWAGLGPGRCPAGANHDHTGSGNYTMLPQPPQVW